MRRWGLGVMVLAAGLVLAGWATAAQAADANATGTWKWKMQARGGGGEEREITLKLKQEGEKLTGAITGMGPQAQETAISDGTIKNGEVAFKVVRKRQDGTEMTSKYTGKLEGDTIKGKIESGTGDQVRSRDWEAKRAKE